MKKKKYKPGGKVVGKSHKKGGEKFKVKSVGKVVELEGGEAVINKKSIEDPNTYTVTGTIEEISSCTNELHGGVNFRESNKPCNIHKMKNKESKFEIKDGIENIQNFLIGKDIIFNNKKETIKDISLAKIKKNDVLMIELDDIIFFIHLGDYHNFLNEEEITDYFDRENIKLIKETKTMASGGKTLKEKEREQINYNKLIGRKDNEFYFLNYIFKDTLHSDPFNGATGIIISPVSKEQFKYATSKKGIYERYSGATEWNDPNTGEEFKNKNKLADHLYTLYNTGQLEIFEEPPYDFTTQMRKLKKFSKESDYPVFEVIGAGRIFSRENNFDEVYDKKLLEEIKEVEPEKFRKGGKTPSKNKFKSSKQTSIKEDLAEAKNKSKGNTYRLPKIQNSYEGKTSEQIWKSWDLQQKKHFLSDHKDFINEVINRNYDLDKYSHVDWTKLPRFIKDTIFYHTQGGQYENGGKTPEVEYWADFEEQFGNTGEVPESTSSKFEDAYKKAVKFYNSEKKKDKNLYGYDYIGVNGTGDKFAILHMNDIMIKSINPNWFKNENNYKKFKEAAEKYSKTKTFQKGKY